jgi:hypothetical protein
MHHHDTMGVAKLAANPSSINQYPSRVHKVCGKHVGVLAGVEILTGDEYPLVKASAAVISVAGTVPWTWPRMSVMVAGCG